MSLHLYRRHSRTGNCPGGHPPDSQTYEADEFRPKWKKCSCPIYASGRLGDNPKFRQNTKCTTWDEARAVADTWERRALHPDDPPPDPPALRRPAPAAEDPPTPASPAAGGPKLITEACAACLAEYETNDATVATFRRYRTVLKKFQQYSGDVKGYLYLHQWQKEDVRNFRVWWKGCNTRTHNTNIGTLKSFFEFCIEDNNWLTVNPCKSRRKRRFVKQAIARMGAERVPFTDPEIEHMLAACARYGRTLGKRYKFRGEDLEDFILISMYTGLRISDVASFHISRLSENGDVHFRALKNGKWVDTWIPEWLQERIRMRAEKFGPYIFGKRNTTDPVTLGNPWRVRLGDLWDMVAKEHGPWSSPPTHHRFRHTFVRILLTGKMSVEKRGLTFTQVAELLGDTEEMVRLHYGRWVDERQDALRIALQHAFALQPKARLVVVK